MLSITYAMIKIVGLVRQILSVMLATRPANVIHAVLDFTLRQGDEDSGGSRESLSFQP
jgi:hypothetical protein